MIIGIGIIGIVAILLIASFAISSAEQEKTKKNINEITTLLNKKNFKTSKLIVSSQTTQKNELRIDMENKKIAICKIFPMNITRIVKFTDIIDCEIIKDSNTIMKGGVGRAIVGGVIAGGVGAIVGANTRSSKNVTNNLQIRIITKNIRDSLITIDLITSETNNDTSEYRSAMTFANDVYATLNAIINKNNENINNDTVKQETIINKNSENINNDTLKQETIINKNNENVNNDILEQEAIKKRNEGKYIEEGISPSGDDDDWIIGYVVFVDNWLLFTAYSDDIDNISESFKININMEDIEYYTADKEDIRLVVKTRDKEYIFGNLETYNALLERIPEKEYEVYKKNVRKNDNVKKDSINDNEQSDNYNINQLEHLAELKDKGIITEQEFEESKKKILSKL